MIEKEEKFIKIFHGMTNIAFHRLLKETELKDIHKEDILKEIGIVWDEMYEFFNNLPDRD